MTQRELDVYSRLQHVADACAAIAELVRGMSSDDYFADQKTQWAVERQFITIGDAMRKALTFDPTLAERITNARKVVDFRNLLTHEYEGIKAEMVWEIIARDVPRLEADVRGILPLP